MTWSPPNSISTTGEWSQGLFKTSYSHSTRTEYSAFSATNTGNHKLQFDTSDNKWYDNTSGEPSSFSKNNGSIVTDPSTLGTWTNNTDTMQCYTSGVERFAFTMTGWSTGPTVTSITVANQNSATRTFTVTHTGTLSASDITYTLDNGYNAPVDIQTLASPNAGVTNIQTTSTGSTFDSYLLSKNGLHSVTIDSTVITFIVDEPASDTSVEDAVTNPISSTTVITPNDSSANTITLYNRAADGKFLGYENSIGHHFNVRLKPNNKARLEVYLRNVTDTHFNDIAYSPLFTIGDQETMTFNYSPYGYDWGFSVLDWAYSADSENNENQGPVSTTSNGGGKPDRYPLIMTNLFNRNRSLYSIGMTHKDTWDLFL